MPTYAELQAEPWWGLETTPPAMRTLAGRLCQHYGIGPGAVGTKGDNKHLRGYHRSRAWILNSQYCTSRTYSVTETLANSRGGDGNWVCGMDITVARAELLPMCQRLDEAVRAGRLEKVTEWYGNTDGDTRVDGYNNIANRVATSDPSHLWHLHMSFERGRANEDHTDLYEILTGVDMPLTDAEVDRIATATKQLILSDGGVQALLVRVEALVSGRDPVVAQPNVLHQRVLAVAQPTPAPVDPAALKAALLDPEVAAAIGAAVRPVVDEEVDEAFRGGVDTGT